MKKIVSLCIYVVLSDNITASEYKKPTSAQIAEMQKIYALPVTTLADIVQTSKSLTPCLTVSEQITINVENTAMSTCPIASRSDHPSKPFTQSLTSAFSTCSIRSKHHA